MKIETKYDIDDVILVQDPGRRNGENYVKIHGIRIDSSGVGYLTGTGPTEVGYIYRESDIVERLIPESKVFGSKPAVRGVRK
jgi:hypothetical protein